MENIIVVGRILFTTKVNVKIEYNVKKITQNASLLFHQLLGDWVFLR